MRVKSLACFPPLGTLPSITTGADVDWVEKDDDFFMTTNNPEMRGNCGLSDVEMGKDP